MTVLTRELPLAICVIRLHPDVNLTGPLATCSVVCLAVKTKQAIM